ncbi:flagellar motor switch protein FliN [bacterium]|nr:flagellar motor switch protein FliN [bacterium]
MSGFEGSENNFNNDFQGQGQGDMSAFGQNPENFGEGVQPQEENHNSRLEELLSSYDPNLSENEQTTFNVDVNQVVEEVVSPHQANIKREKTVEADTSVSLGETFDKQEDEIVTVQPIKFASFENDQIALGTPKKNLDIMQDIMIKVTVELGRCKMKLKKVLDIQKGSIIEINKVAGEQVELFVSGKLVAIGEVIVMEDKFGLRITSIVEDKQI